MSFETNDDPPPARKAPKLFPEPPPPLEPAPLPRAILRLRTSAPEPTEKPRRNQDHQRELFFINWKAHNPGGQADSEDFERAYGDFQIKQFEAKTNAHDRSPSEFKTIVIRLLLVGILILAALSAARWVRTKFAPNPLPRNVHSGGQPSTVAPRPAATGTIPAQGSSTR